ncbi:MAG: carbohydrate kinase family protein [Candidatus Bipolaricaulia bacterium]
MSRIVVLGDLNLDVHAQHPNNIEPGSEIRSVVRANPGGSAGTFARVAASEGASVTFFGCVGNDLIGDLLVRSLEQSGITPIVARADAPSGTILALEQGSERTMVCSRGANDGLTPESIDRSAFETADHLHVSGYAFLSPNQREAARRAIGLACAGTMTVSVDPPPASLIASFGPDAFLAELEEVSWLFPNFEEGRTLTDRENAEEIVGALAESFQRGAVTLGSSGALAWNGQDRDLHRPPEQVSGDSTGAGDAYAAAFVVSILGGRSISESNARGCAVAGDHIRRGRKAHAQ